MTVSVIKNADGALIPEQYAQMIVPRNTKAVGFVMVDGGELNVTTGLGELSYDTLMSFQEEDKDKLMIFHLIDEELKKEDIPPFSVEKDSNPLIVAFLSGKFENYKDLDLAHSPARNCFDQHMRPMILRIMENNDGKIDKSMKDLDSADTRMNIRNMMSDGDHCIIVAHTGEVLRFSKKAEFTKFPWGETSDTYDYKEEPEAKPTSNVLADLKASILADRAKRKGAPEKKEEPVVEETPAELPKLPDGVHQVPSSKKETSPPKLFKSTGKNPDGSTMSKSQIEQDYITKAGWLPPKAHKRPEVRVMIAETAIQAAMKKAEDKLPKDMPDIPLMSEETIKKAKHFFQEQNKLTKDPGKAGEEEQDYPDYSEALGPGGAKMVLDMLEWRYDQWHNWIKSVGPQPIAILICELAYNIQTLRGPVEEEDTTSKAM